MVMPCLGGTQEWPHGGNLRLFITKLLINHGIVCQRFLNGASRQKKEEKSEPPLDPTSPLKTEK
jgi:hypothetical protein